MRNAFLLLWLIAVPLSAQEFDFRENGDVARLAQEVLPSVKAADDLFRVQAVAGRYEDALKTLPSPLTARAVYEAYLRAKTSPAPFAEAYPRAFREAFAHLDDRTAAIAIRALMINERFIKFDLDDELAKQKGKDKISLAGAVALIRAYQNDAMFKEFAPLVTPLVDEDDQRRYVIEKDISVKTPDGATVCAFVMRQRSLTGRAPALLQFTIYNDPVPVMFEMRRSASEGYASVTGFTRGKACSPETPVPYEHDAGDAAAVIDWIAKQPWSDGRVGMYGGSYSGFTAWAAAKRMPKALKAIDVGAAAAPGADVPMEGNVVWTFVYPWPFYTLDNKTVDDATYTQFARWRKLDRDWYVSGRAFSDYDKIDGTPNPIFDRWLAHPSYDAYWQSMVPYGKEFARIDIPILQTAGYYFGGPGAAVYYLEQHVKYRPTAEDYLVIGPYDHLRAQRGTRNALGGDEETINGYTRDPAALIDLVDLRYRFFDYVFKGAPKPPILKDKINYEVTGANVWKHAPNLAAMAHGAFRLHLGPSRTQTINLADRSDVDVHRPGGGVQDKELDTTNGFAYISEPFEKPVEMSGLFSGELDFITNKKDFDFELDLFEKTPDGEYVQLAPFWSRASYVRDRSHRQLLTPGKRQTLRFQAIRLMSRQLQKGSRLVVVLSVIKEPGRQINLGTGKDVNDETTADAKEPLRIEWLADSYVDVPVTR